MLVVVLALAVVIGLMRRNRSKMQPTFTSGEEIAVVIAHPDDESMFFLPLLQNLTKKKKKVHLLCLSEGNFDGLGKIRRTELHQVSAFLQLTSTTVMNHPQLQDGPNNYWDKKVIAAQVSAFVNQKNIDTIITFDECGISGHQNHIDVHHGLKHFVSENASSKIQVFTLETTNIFRKYIGILDYILQLIVYPTPKIPTFVFTTFRPWINYTAMSIHNSQFVWYRRLFVIFSRYTFVNTLNPMKKLPKNS